MVDEYEYKILSQYAEKQLGFAMLNVLKGHFCSIYKDFGIFWFSNFVLFDALKSVLVSFFGVLDEKPT